MSRVKTNRSLINKLALTTALFTAASLPAMAVANPWDSFTDEHGTIGIDTSIANHTNINQVGDLYIGNSTNLDILSGESVNIDQNSTSSTFVAKSNNGSDPTRILGSLSTKIRGTNSVGGSVMILDRNGVFFGVDAQIDTGGIIASTGELNNQRLIDDGMIELSNFGDGKVINNGTITIAEGGLAAFVAPTVVNNGIITAKAGRVELGGANTTTTIDLYGDGLMEIAVDNDNVDALLSRNDGEIYAEEGTIHMTTGAAKEIVDSMVNMQGIARVDSVTQKAGKIILGGSNTGKVRVAGAVQARGRTEGGSIDVTAKDVLMTGSGILNARAQVNGDGGTVTVNASNNASLAGRLSVKGGDNGGDAGVITTNAANELYINRNLEVFASALNGQAGSWVIDPVNFEVNAGVATVFTNVLNDGAAINASASNDVMVNAALNWTGGGSLTLNAGNDLLLNSTISGNGNFTGTAGRNIVFAGSSSTSLTGADLSLSAGSDIFFNNGSLVDVANGNMIFTALNANGGNSAIEIDGDIQSTNGDITFNATNYFVELNPTGSINQTNGTFTANSNVGFDIDAGAVANLGSAAVVINAPDVRLGADINTTGTISGTATTVAVENNAAEIQDGVDVAASGATVTVGNGTYNENVLINKSLTLQSVNGRGATTITGLSNGTALGTIQITPNVNNVTLGGINKGFTIVGIDNGNPGIENAAVYLQGAHSDVTVQGNEIVANGDAGLMSEYAATIDNLVIDNNIFSGQTFTGANPAGVGFGGQFSDNNVPRQLVVVGGGNGGGNTSNVTFTNNNVTGTAGGISTDDGVSEQGNTLVTIDSQGATITGNTFAGTTTRYGAALRARGTDTLIAGNTFDAANMGKGTLHVYANEGIYSGTAAATHANLEELVDANTFLNGATWAEDDGATYDNISTSIQGGIGRSTAGTTLHVLDANYDENIVVDRDLTIVGDSKSGVVVTPASNTGTAGDARAWWLVNDGVNLNLSNMTLDGAGFDVWQAIRHKGSGNIDNIAFKNITYNPSTSYQGTAVAAFGTGPVNITNSTFENIGRVGALYFGTALSGSVFADNTYTGKGAGDWLDYALDISNGAQVDVLRNTITNNYGVASSDGSASAGILVSTYFGAGTSANLANNYINNNSNAVYVGFDGTDTSVVTAHNNDLSGNTNAVGSSSLLSTADFSGNWWGTTDDASIAASMVGAGADNVDFTPYLDSGVDTDAGTNGFQGDHSKLHVTALGAQTGATGRIQEAVDQIENGILSGNARTVQIHDGTFAESTNIDRALIMTGNGRNNTIITPGASKDGFIINSDIGDYGRVYIRNLTVDGGRNGVNFTNAANAGTLMVGGSTFKNNAMNGIRVGGDYTDVNLDNLIVNYSNFENNGNANTGVRGDGDILAFYYNGDASFNHVTISNDGAAAGIEADYGIQLRGRADGTTWPPVNAAAMGTVSFNNVTVSGDYRAALIGIQGYDSSADLTFDNVTLGGTTNGGATSEAWTALYLSLIGSDDLDIGNMNFAGGNMRYIDNLSAGNVDARDAVFEGVNGATATLAENFAIEDKIDHALDVSGLGLVTWKDNNVFVTQDSNSIQRGVDASNVGGIVNLNDGTYNENVNVNKSVSINGNSADATKVVVQGAGSGNGITLAADDINLRYLTVQGFANGLYTNTAINNVFMRNVNSYGNSNYGFEIHNDADVNGLDMRNVRISNNGSIGMRVRGAATNVSIAGGIMSGNKQGLVSVAGNGEDKAFDNVTITNTKFVNNTQKGIYLEKLSNANIKGIEVRNSGTDVAYNNNAGIDVNLKYGAYENITFDNINVNGSGVNGTGTGNAFTVKARNDDYYAGNPASLTNLVLKNSDITAGGDVAVAIGYGVDGVTIENNTNITGSEAVLTYGGVQNASFLNNLITSTGLSSRGASYGIAAIGNGGTTIIDDNTINGADVGSGILLVNGDVNEVTKNTVKNFEYGIDIHGGNSSLVKNNTVKQTASGIIAEDAAGLNIRKNTIAKSSESGIDVTRSDNAQIVNNEVKNSYIGVYLEDGTGAILDKNTLTNFAHAGIVADGSTNTTMTQNLIQSTKANTAGIELFDTVGTTIGGDDASDENMIYDVDFGIGLSFDTDTKIDGNDFQRIGFAGLISDFDPAHTSTNLVVTDNTFRDGGLAMLIANAKGAVIGGKNHGNVVTDNGGIVLLNSNKSEISHNELTNILGNAITLVDSNNAAIKKNTVDTTTLANGVKVLGGKNVIVSANDIRNTEDDGIDVADSKNIVIKNNIVTNAGEDGIDVEYSKNAIIKGNEVYSATANGIDVLNSKGATIVSNIIDDSGMNGIGVEGRRDVTVKKNTITGGLNGVSVNDSAFATIAENDISGTSANGVLLNNSEGSLIKGNTVLDAGSNGYFVMNSDDTELRNNLTRRAGGDGFIIQTSDNVVVDNNRAINSGANGIRLMKTDNATVSGNKAKKNNDAGIVVASSTNTTVDGNTANDNVTGILVSGTNIVTPVGGPSDNTIITNNDINGNTTAGLSTQGNSVGLVTLTSNTLTDNTVGMLFRGGEIDISDLLNPNTINGGTTGMVFNPIFSNDPLSLTNNTLGSTIFNGQSGNYIELSNGALFNPGTPTNIDALAVNFDGTIALNSPLGAGILTAVQREAIENRIIDFDDLPTLGQIIVGFELNLSAEDLFALDLYSLQVPSQNVNVTFTGLPPVSLDLNAFANIAPAAGGDASDFANIAPAAGGDGAEDLASLEPASGGNQGCWGQFGNADFSGAVTFSFGGGIEGALDDGSCTQ